MITIHTTAAYLCIIEKKHKTNFVALLYNNDDGRRTADQLEQARSYLKGCYMHWIQSVIRIARNHAVIPVEQANDFLNLIYSLITNIN